MTTLTNREVDGVLDRGYRRRSYALRYPQAFDLIYLSYGFVVNHDYCGTSIERRRRNWRGVAVLVVPDGSILRRRFC